MADSSHRTEYSLENLEKLARLLHDVQRVKRISRRPDEQELTNTAEHTFELAMMCWYIASVHKLDLDMQKVLTYALAHDTIEAYAGDTPMHDEEAKKTKQAREEAALARIEKEFQDFPEFISALHEYERRDTPEAKFVYATDKLVDPLNLSMETKHSMWKEYDMSFETLVSNKDDKIAFSDVIQMYWKKLVAKLEAKKDFFFHS